LKEETVGSVNIAPLPPPPPSSSSSINKWLETITVSLGAFFILFGVAYVMTNMVPSIGSAVLNYSGRTFSGFGKLVVRVSPQEKSKDQQVVAEIVSPPIIETIPEEKPIDLSLKISDTERVVYELYVNSQTLSSKTQELLGKSKTLTVPELNDAVKSMFDVLGSISAQFNLINENWSFPALASVIKSSDQVNSILDSLKSESLSVFTKPEINDLTDLVYQAELLQRLVGNSSDLPTDDTVFGNLNKEKIQIAEIAKVLPETASNSGEITENILGVNDTNDIKPEINTTPLPVSTPAPDTQKVVGLTIGFTVLSVLVVSLLALYLKSYHFNQKFINIACKRYLQSSGKDLDVKN
jgi:hypothetical protein